jgi:type VI secretion system secreted protein VgrG
VAQSMAGKSWGAMVLPRVGQEVVVEFLEGNPDRPLVTGVVYNATNTVPYALSDNQTRTTFKSNSSKGGGGFNELRFEDKKDSEEVFFQAQKDYNKVVLNNETVTITQDTTTTVQKGNRSVTVQKGSDSHTVSEGSYTVDVTKGDMTITADAGNRTTKINKTETLTVDTGDYNTTVTQGNHSLKISAGTSTIEAAQSITLKVGENTIVIDTSGITIKAMKIAVQSTSGDINLQSQANLSAQATTQMSMKATSAMSLDGGLSLSAKATAISLN